MLPTIATPSAPPSSRVVSLTAEPMSGAVARQCTHDRLGGGGARESHAGTHEEHRDRQSAVASGRRDGGGDREAGRERQHPRRHDTLGAEARDELRRQRRGDDHRSGVGQHAQAGGRRRVAEHELEVLRREKQEPEEREEQHRDGGTRGGEPRVPEQAHVEQRLIDPTLPRDERHERDCRHRDRGEHGEDVQPLLGASMIAHTKTTRPTPERTAPVQSIRCATGSRDSGTSSRAAMIAAATMGTFTMNTEPHQKWSSRKPPTTGPRATPTPAVAAQIPIAIARSRASVKTLVSSDSVAGMMNAAPAPMTARAVTS